MKIFIYPPIARVSPFECDKTEKKTSITPKIVGRIHHKKPALMSGPAKSPSHASRSGPQQIDGYTTPRSLHCWPSSV